jgi:septal ring factor EnvC (AmiA/AmiB activator)
MIEHDHPAFGDDPAYDAQVARESAMKRAKYAAVAERVRLERTLEDLANQLANAQNTEAERKAALDDAKEVVRVLKKQIKEADPTRGAHRRAENARLQAEAVERGEKTYVTGMPCRNGHYASRYVSSGACTECDRIGWKDGKLRSQVKLTASA